MRNAEKIYGKGVRFPLVIGAGFDWIAGSDAVAQALRSVLLTEPGERVGRPTYGVGLRRFLFASNTLATRAAIRQTVVDAIARDERRVNLDDVEVVADTAEPTLLRIEVRYRLAGEASLRNLVFPFYLDRGVA